VRTLSFIEGRDWLAHEGIPIDLDNPYDQPKELTAYFRIDHDSGTKTVLARSIAFDLFEGMDTLFAVTESGVWPSSEYEFVFQKYRAGLGVSRPLRESDFHLFDKEETDSLGGAIALSLYFVWGFLVSDLRGDIIVAASHDEYLQCWADDSQALERMVALFLDLGLERLYKSKA